MLLTKLAGHGDDQIPSELANADTLTPWAVAMRYDEMEATLDRDAALRTTTASLNWATAIIAAARATPPSLG